MSVSAQGHKSYLQGAPETSFGVVAGGWVPTWRWDLIDWNPEPQPGSIADTALWGRRSRRAMTQGLFKVKGTATIRIGYEGYLEIFRSLLGGYSSNLVQTSVRDHFAVEGTTLTSQQVECAWGDMPAGKVAKLSGFRILGATLKISAANSMDGLVTVDLTWVAKDMVSNQNPTVPAAQSVTTNGTTTLTTAGNFSTAGVTVGMVISLTGGVALPAGLTVVTVGTTTLVMSAAVPTASGLTAAFAPPFPPYLPILFHQSGTAGWVDDGYVFDGSLRTRSVEVSIECPHDEDRNYLGSAFIDEPLPDDFAMARWKFTQEFNSITQYDAARAFTVGSPRLQFQHPTTIGASSKREMEIRSGQANITGFTAPIRGPKLIIATVTLESFFDNSDQSATYLRFRNTEAALP